MAEMLKSYGAKNCSINGRMGVLPKTVRCCKCLSNSKKGDLIIEEDKIYWTSIGSCLQDHPSQTSCFKVV